MNQPKADGQQQGSACCLFAPASTTSCPAALIYTTNESKN
jgi:hypothetical protein